MHGLQTYQHKLRLERNAGVMLNGYIIPSKTSVQILVLKKNVPLKKEISVPIYLQRSSPHKILLSGTMRLGKNSLVTSTPMKRIVIFSVTTLLTLDGQRSRHVVIVGEERELHES